MKDKSIAITIDDAYQSFYQFGFPVLKKNNISATLFLSTESVGSSDFLNWTPGFDNIIYFDSDEKKCKESLLKSDLVFTLDFNDLNRIGELNEFDRPIRSSIQ